MKDKGKINVSHNPWGGISNNMRADLIVMKVDLTIKEVIKQRMQRQEGRKKEVKQRILEEGNQKKNKKRSRIRKKKKRNVRRNNAAQDEEKEQSQPPIEEEGRQMQDQELSHQIEQMIEINDTEAELELQNQDVDLIPNTKHVTIQSPPLLAAYLDIGK